MKNPDWTPMLPMNLQLFAEEGADPAAGKTGEDAAGTEGQHEQDPGSEKGGGKDPGDMSRLVAREARKAVEKLLVDAGITPGDNPEMQLKEYKAWLDAQKTDLEKAQGTAETATKERDTLAAQNLLLERKMLTLEQGVPADRAEKYIHLALTYQGAEEDFGKALEAALADFPLATGKKGSAAAAANPGSGPARQPTANAGQEAAQRRLARQKRSTDALKRYEGKE